MVLTQSCFEIVDCEDRLSHLAEEWSDLCNHAIEPNPFYRPELLLPALRLNLPGATFRIVFVRSPSGQLIGMFPFQVGGPRWWGSQVVFRPLTHRYCYVRTPIIREGFIEDNLSSIAEALRQFKLPARLIRLHGFALDDEFEHELTQSSVGLSTFRFTHTRRSALVRGREIHPSTKATEEYASKWRKLSQLGELCLKTDGAGDPLFHRRLSEFLDLEHRGWKASRASSMKSAGAPSEYFSASVVGHAESGLWTVDSVLLDGQPIAMQLNLIDCGRHVVHYGFKSAFDDSLARYSPGAVMLNEQRLRFHTSREIDVFDSCADPKNLAVRRLWPDRLERPSFYVAADTLIGRSYMAAAQWKANFRGTRMPARTSEVL